MPPPPIVLETKKKTNWETHGNVGALDSFFRDFVVMVDEEAMPPQHCGHQFS
jgi:hypothetical protein